MTKKLPTEDRQRQIAQAALEIIARDGLGRFTTAAIAREVGLAEGTIFRHFANKEEIGLRALELMKERFADGFPPEHEDPLERLGLFLRQRLQLVLSHPGVFRAFFSDQLAQAAGEEGEVIVLAIKQETTDFILSCLQELADSGHLRVGLDPAFLVRIIQGTIHSFAFGPQQPSLDSTLESSSPTSVAERAWQTVVGLIGR